LLGDGNLHWFLGKYAVPGKEREFLNVLTGSYPSPEKGKSVLVVGKAFSPDKAYDYKTTLWLCDQMATDYTAHGNGQRSTDKKLIAPGEQPKTEAPVLEKEIATDKEVDDFVGSLDKVIQSKFKTPEDIEDLLKKKKPPKIRTALNVVINEDGSVKKLEITEPGDFDSATTALTKAVNNSTPFEAVPHTKDGQISVIVKLDGSKIKVERP
jgi:hypothetical protein